MRFVILTCLAASVLAQQPTEPAKPAGGQRPAPKNLKILKPEEVMPAMRSYTAALGQQCSFCHIQGNMASDDNKHKDVAREMILMTRDLNARLGGADAKVVVTCYTCHRGAAHPATAPDTAAAAPATPTTPATPATPPAPPK
jgi:hypothetical protein